MNPEPGTVQVLGLYEGPTESWEPRADVLAVEREESHRRQRPGDLVADAVVSRLDRVEQGRAHLLRRGRGFQRLL